MARAIAKMAIQIRKSEISDADTVADLVHALLSELTPEGEKKPSRDAVRSSSNAILKEKCGVWALLAEDDEGRPAGVLTLNECASIYAGGKFGEISELYVVPQFRSAGAGQQLIRAAVRFGHGRKWRRLEVGAPDVPRWNRTVDFYLKNGFAEVGPRLKLLL